MSMSDSLSHLGSIWCRSEPYIKVALEKNNDILPIGLQTYGISLKLVSPFQL